MAFVETSDSEISRSSSSAGTRPQPTPERPQNGGQQNQGTDNNGGFFIDRKKLLSRDGILRAVQMSTCLLAFILVQTARWCHHIDDHLYLCDSNRVPVYRFFPAVTVSSFAVTFLIYCLDVTCVLDKFHDEVRGWPIVILLVLTHAGICAICLFFASAVLAGEGYTSNGLIVASVFGFLAFAAFALHFALVFTKQFKSSTRTSQTQASLDIYVTGSPRMAVNSHVRTDPVEAQIQQPTCSILLMRPRKSPSVSPQNPRRSEDSYSNYYNNQGKSDDTHVDSSSSRSESPISQRKWQFVCNHASEERLSSWAVTNSKLEDNLSTDTFTVEVACT